MNRSQIFFYFLIFLTPSITVGASTREKLEVIKAVADEMKIRCITVITDGMESLEVSVIKMFSNLHYQTGIYNWKDLHKVLRLLNNGSGRCINFRNCSMLCILFSS